MKYWGKIEKLPLNSAFGIYGLGGKRISAYKAMKKNKTTCYHVGCKPKSNEL